MPHREGMSKHKNLKSRYFSFQNLTMPRNVHQPRLVSGRGTWEIVKKIPNNSPLSLQLALCPSSQKVEVNRGSQTSTNSPHTASFISPHVSVGFHSQQFLLVLFFFSFLLYFLSFFLITGGEAKKPGHLQLLLFCVELNSPSPPPLLRLLLGRRREKSRCFSCCWMRLVLSFSVSSSPPRTCH